MILFMAKTQRGNTKTLHTIKKQTNRKKKPTPPPRQKKEREKEKKRKKERNTSKKTFGPRRGPRDLPGQVTLFSGEHLRSRLGHNISYHIPR